MPDITVFPHGDRWAVAERGSESPLQEFPTREAAELSAGATGGGRSDVPPDAREPQAGL